ncbi:MAG: DUF1573 domain-containing protein [Nitrospinota bacterium]|jgi:hypothetical protein
MKKAKYLVIPIIFLSILFVVSQSLSGNLPRITIIPKEINLGFMKKGEAKLYKVIIGNSGDGDLFISNINAPNEESGIPLNKKAIKPGKKVEITFFYKTTASGKFKDHVLIKSNDPEEPSVKIFLVGESE